MLKKNKFGFFCVLGFLVMQSFSAQAESIRLLSLTVKYEYAPHQIYDLVFDFIIDSEPQKSELHSTMRVGQKELKSSTTGIDFKKIAYHNDLSGGPFPKGIEFNAVGSILGVNELPNLIAWIPHGKTKPVTFEDNDVVFSFSFSFH